MFVPCVVPFLFSIKNVLLQFLKSDSIFTQLIVLLLSFLTKLLWSIGLLSEQNICQVFGHCQRLDVSIFDSDSPERLHAKHDGL